MFLETPPPPPLLLTGAAVWVDDGRKAAARPGQAVLLQGPRILAVGPAQRLATAHPGARRVDLPGGTLLPGFIEGHAHVEGLGRLATHLNLAGLSELPQVLARVKAWADAHPEGWIQGRGWDQNLWARSAFPSAQDLDAVTGPRPAVLGRVDGHALWANTAAMAAAGITPGTPDPEGGRVLRDAEGRPTGIFIDTAADLITRALPPPTPDQRAEDLRSGLLALRRFGFTSVADMGCDAGSLAAYRRLATAGTLPIRVFAYLDPDPALLQKELARPRPRGLAFFQVQGVKLYLDGALGSRGARLLEPYADEPGTRGLWLEKPERVATVLRQTLAAGYQPAVHAIGDAANREMVTMALALSGQFPGAPQIRDEHSQIVAEADARRFGRARLVASVQPIHLADDHAWTPARLGAARLDRAFPWRIFLEGGALLCFGSDAPVADPNPFLGLAAAESRQDAAGGPKGGFRPEHRLTRAEGVRAYTLSNAQVLGHPDLGILRAGAAADLLWVQAPLECVSLEGLRKLTPARLWVNGVEVPL